MNRTILRVMLFFGVSVTTLYANKYDEQFHKASKLFAQKEYQQALDLYASLKPQGTITYYNQGVVLYHLKDYARALAFFKKAHFYADAALQKKIAFNVARTQEKLGVPLDPWWYTWLLLVQSYCSLFLFQLIFLISSYLFYLSLGQHTIFEKMRVPALVLFVASGAVVGAKYWILKQHSAVVITQNAKVFAGPNNEFHEVSDLKYGQEVKVVDQEESWYKMLYPHGKGWIQKSDVEEVKP